MSIAVATLDSIEPLLQSTNDLSSLNALFLSLPCQQEFTLPKGKRGWNINGHKYVIAIVAIGLCSF